MANGGLIETNLGAVEARPPGSDDRLQIQGA
jgi:hypothetical protein